MPSEEGVEDGDPAAVIEPSPHQGAAPPEFEPLGTEAPRATHPKVSYEVPVGLINDVLLEEELCSKMLNSLKRVYNHHKKMALRSRVKSSILAVKSERLQQVPALK